MKVVIHSLKANEGKMLFPAPNVTDWVYIQEALENDTMPRFRNIEDILGKPLKILTSYRSNMMYLEGGVSFYRTNPIGPAGHGYGGVPQSGYREEASMEWEGKLYTIDAEFI